MGYTTDFSGCFNLNKPLDRETQNILKGLNNTRRMKRSVKKLAERLNISVEKCIEEYGKEGEFYFDNDNLGQNETSDVVNYNEPPSCQPSLWCAWKYNNDENTIEWDGSEKFYEYIEWMNYIKKILENKNYKLEGCISWMGEENGDVGNIEIKESKISITTNYTKYTL